MSSVVAVTAIWAVRGWLGQVVIYAGNPDKTQNPAFFEKQDMTARQAQGLSDVIDYAAQILKTGIADERAEIKRHFVTGINCQPETARDEMMATKKHYGKDAGVAAYHGYQSFAPGETDAETAHEIGVKLARRLWGGRFQVIVATHLDKANHLHNHFVVNNVSMLDGRKYYRSESDYYNMRTESDALCREYGLSVIGDPRRGKARQYGEWKAERDGKSTYRSLLKADLDRAILESMTERQLWDNLYKKGYRIKFGKDVTLRPPGKDRGLKLYRNFGEDYSIQSIRNRILENTRPERYIIPADSPPKKTRLKGTFHRVRRMSGLRALYLYYLRRMGALPKRREPSPARIYFLYREDIRYIQNIARETRLLATYRIDTAGQLSAFKDAQSTQINDLYSRRKHLRYQARSIRDAGGLAATKSEIAALSVRIGALRREVMLCEGIEKRSVDMRDKIHRARNDEKSTVKGMMRREPFRGRG